ncbi:TPA: 50S ribosomal protein L29 [Candidatus Saccharibacteria bacterium]|nr:50S ribosomal protein L29 [Candidatus Saccharibacteria bacterium]HIO87392.1 50S ribosomal protein L29 [Candidatus Saccharibacteria bacterium]
MNISEIRGQDVKKLQDLLATKRAELAEKVREKRVSERGNLHEARQLRTDIAKILTVINEETKEETA